MPGERLISETQLHWITFLWPALIFACGVFLLTTNPRSRMDGDLGAQLAALAFLGMAFVWDKDNEVGLAMTDKRIIHKTGVIRTKYSEILLSQIDRIEVNQSLLGRMLDYETITVSDTRGWKTNFTKIEQPFEFRRRVRRQMEDRQEIAIAEGQNTALINCSECGKEISARAIACPSCGVPVATVEKQPDTAATSALGWIATGLGMAGILMPYFAAVIFVPAALISGMVAYRQGQKGWGAAGILLGLLGLVGVISTSQKITTISQKITTITRSLSTSTP